MDLYLINEIFISFSEVRRAIDVEVSRQINYLQFCPNAFVENELDWFIVGAIVS